ncbi:DUF3883 domain-containing protein [Pseudomonas citronellolis]|uniref:DUF3883 domain-containing protein n=1 Tax=Pseudomonas citronellolis TaxID=53408 RepID=UPI0021BF0AFA|nr:DUF3883 domain-containing protein [Pseudomonas citronellolis]UXJ50809.1 DUF3883 domain-containing protein [Pseudomonas citronellolis]
MTTKNIWLIPASNQLATENLGRSMENKIDIEIRHALRKRGIDYDYAWGAQRGTNDSNVSIYNAMQAGDICLFYTADQREIDEPIKAYRWASRITHTLMDAELANQVWPPRDSSAPFELMYFLTTPVKVFITTDELSLLLTQSGEKYASPPKGFMKLDAKNLDFVVSRYGSAEGFLTHVLTHYAEEDAPIEEYTAIEQQPDPVDLVPAFVDDLLAIKKVQAKGKGTLVQQRRSRRSKEVGDEAELYILNLLRQGKVPNVTASNVLHVADQKLGWDIEYSDKHGNRIKVEVKGSVAGRFSNFELTINELNCLKEHGNRYHLYLVGGCKSGTPKVQVITDMADRLARGAAAASPITFRIELLEL